MTRRRIFHSIIVLSVMIGWCAEVSAQELAPRAYWPSPNGTNVLTLAYQHSTGDILTDPSLPITGVNSNINLAQLSYQRTFSLWQRTTTLQFNLPYSWGTTEGFVEGQYRNTSVSGIADARVRFAVNLLGAPSMDAKGFQALRANPRTQIGASLLVQVPVGEYDPDKLINVGTNRWAVKPAVGIIWPMYPTWLLEFELGVWLFGDNDEFVGTTREQDPILSTEAHLVKRFRPGFWASLDANYYVGGQTTVGQEIREDLQRNSRIGASIVYSFKPRHAIRASFSAGVVSESGGDFNIFSMSYIYSW
jgi:hypothetical protein